MATTARGSNLAALVGIALIWSIASTALAVGREFWIDRGGYRNSAGCEPPGQIAVTGDRRLADGVRDLSDIYARAEQSAQYRVSWP